jgi:pimeloyl-ACP methyl ester carboxylesterase
MEKTGQVQSPDGSVIGFEVRGSGPPIVLVHGTTADRTRWLTVVDQLAARYTVYAVDRRGRGLSVEESAEPHSIQREAEDVAAVVEAAGTGVYLVGHSFGAICSLEASMLTAAIGRMVLYEPPIPTPGHAVFPPGALDRVRAGAASGDREQLLQVFFREVIELPEAAIDELRSTPVWPARLKAAHTLLREGEAVESYEIPDGLSSISIPVRVFLGTESPHYFRPAAEGVLAAIPGADLVPMVGQAHNAMDQDPEQFVAAVFGFADEA